MKHQVKKLCHYTHTKNASSLFISLSVNVLLLYQQATDIHLFINQYGMETRAKNKETCLIECRNKALFGPSGVEQSRERVPYETFYGRLMIMKHSIFILLWGKDLSF